MLILDCAANVFISTKIMLKSNMTAIDKFKQFYQQLNSKDISGLPSVYSHDIEFIDPITTHYGISNVTLYFAQLFENTRSCSFDIKKIESTGEKSFVVEWQMGFVSKKLSKNKEIKVDGVTLLKTNNDLVIYHRDYYDLGQLIYENIPLLGAIVKRIKEQMR